MGYYFMWPFSWMANVTAQLAAIVKYAQAIQTRLEGISYDVDQTSYKVDSLVALLGDDTRLGAAAAELGVTTEALRAAIAAQTGGKTNGS